MNLLCYRINDITPTTCNVLAGTYVDGDVHHKQNLPNEDIESYTKRCKVRRYMCSPQYNSRRYIKTVYYHNTFFMKLTYTGFYIDLKIPITDPSKCFGIS